MSKIYFQVLSIFAVVCVLTICSSCCSSASKTTKENKTSVDRNLPESLPPGNANVTGLIKELIEDEKYLTATLKIEEVFGYGPSTPILPPGSEIKIYVLKSLIKDQGNKFMEGEELSMRIAIQQGANENNKWMFKYFIKKTN